MFNIFLLFLSGVGTPKIRQQNKGFFLKEKGTIVLANGSVRNTMTVLKNQGFYPSQCWIEGLGATSWIGLLDPLVAGSVLDGTKISFVCINNKKTMDGTGNCTIYYHKSEIECPCFSVKIIENEKSEITLFPNPTTGQLTINNGQVTIYSVELYDVMGKKAFEQNAEGKKQKNIDISGLHAGNYLIRISTEKGVFTKKVVKQ